jgi:serine/threonine protein kinase/tetratricopeptide (TPR) repeat protein
MSVRPLDEQAIFEGARNEQTAELREAYLDQHCGNDAELRRRIEALLRAYDEGESFLESPPPELRATALGGTDSPTIERSISEGAGTVIGPYKLLQQIGEGGMGVVFMAEQTEPIQRSVALKIIRPGMDTRQVIARFEAERQALAMMDHPNIAKVLDAGMTAPASGYPGRPYFVMELVKGVPITEFCDEKQLSVRDRMQLLLPVCEAVQHAHQKGIIHRDIKPTNVLVAEYDNRAVPKVIDFGVAKATAHRLTERTMFTEFGQVIGTVEYMSPEQAKLNQLDIDTRSDIYSLGVLLYELLTGTTPFERRQLQEAAFDEMLRIIREDEPPKPSTKLSSQYSLSHRERAGVREPSSLASIAANRHTEPARLSKEVRGELDWIVMKALEKDRGRRYETANALALDVQRYLADEPVLAGPPSAVYRVKKFAHRYRVPLAIAAAVVLTVIAGFATSTHLIAKERDSAQAAAQRESEAAERERTAAAEAQGQRAEADRERQRAETNLRKAREAVDRVFTLAAEKMVHQPHMEQIRRALLEDALEFYQGFLNQSSTDPSIQHETARAGLRVAWIYMLVGKPTKSEEPLRQAAHILERLSTEFPTVAEYRVDLALAYDRLAMQFGHPIGAGFVRWEGGIAERRKELAVREKLVDDFPTVPQYRDDLAYCHSGLGNCLVRVGQNEEAEQQYRQALAVLAKRQADFPNFGQHLGYLAHAHHWLGNVLMNTNRLEEAEKHLRESLALREQLVVEEPNGSNRQHLSHIQAWLGDLHSRMGKPNEAEQFYRDAIATMGGVVAEFPSTSEYSRQFASYHGSLGRLLKTTGQAQEAEMMLQRQLAIRNKMLADFPDLLTQDPGFLAWDHYDLALLYHGADRPREAVEHFRQAIDGMEKALARLPDEARLQSDLAAVLANCPAPQFRDPRRAVELAKKALRHEPLSESYWRLLGAAHYRVGEFKDAIEALEKSVELSSEEDALNWFFLAMAHWRLRHGDEAREFYRKAIQKMDKDKPTDEELRRFRAETEKLLEIDTEANTK